MKTKVWYFIAMVFVLGSIQKTCAQISGADSIKPRKNIVRYNLTGALLFGIDKYIVLGYERVLSPRKSISINIGRASLPKLVSIETDSFQTKKEGERKGYNLSVDYRFYLGKENKFDAPHGLYIGPYYSYNHFEREQLWTYKRNTTMADVSTSSDLNIHTFGFELGYQFILWKRFALDMIMIGPGLGFYDYKATFAGNSNLTAEQKEQLRDALQQMLTQKFPGMNYVFSDKTIDADGVLKTKNIGYRYIVHIGYNF